MRERGRYIGLAAAAVLLWTPNVAGAVSVAASQTPPIVGPVPKVVAPFYLVPSSRSAKPTALTRLAVVAVTRDERVTSACVGCGTTRFSEKVSSTRVTLRASRPLRMRPTTRIIVGVTAVGSTGRWILLGFRGGHYKGLGHGCMPATVTALSPAAATHPAVIPSASCGPPSPRGTEYVLWNGVDRQLYEMQYTARSWKRPPCRSARDTESGRRPASSCARAESGMSSGRAPTADSGSCPTPGTGVMLRSCRKPGNWARAQAPPSTPRALCTSSGGDRVGKEHCGRCRRPAASGRRQRPCTPDRSRRRRRSSFGRTARWTCSGRGRIGGCGKCRTPKGITWPARSAAPANSARRQRPSSTATASRRSSGEAPTAGSGTCPIRAVTGPSRTNGTPARSDRRRLRSFTPAGEGCVLERDRRRAPGDGVGRTVLAHRVPRAGVDQARLTAGRSVEPLTLAHLHKQRWRTCEGADTMPAYRRTSGRSALGVGSVGPGAT